MTSLEDLLWKGKPFILNLVATSQTHSSAHPRRTRIKFDLQEHLYTKKWQDFENLYQQKPGEYVWKLISYWPYSRAEGT